MRSVPLPPSGLLLAIQHEAAVQRRTAYGIAKVSGVALSTVQRVLSGRCRPTITTLEAVAEALGLVIEARRR